MRQDKVAKEKEQKEAARVLEQIEAVSANFVLLLFIIFVTKH